MVPTAERDAVWQRLAQLLPESYYQQAATEITLEQAPAYAADSQQHDSRPDAGQYRPVILFSAPVGRRTSRGSRHIISFPTGL